MHLLHNALFVDYTNVEAFLGAMSEKYSNMPEFTNRMCDVDIALSGGMLRACGLWDGNTMPKPCVE